MAGLRVCTMHVASWLFTAWLLALHGWLFGLQVAPRGGEEQPRLCQAAGRGLRHVRDEGVQLELRGAQLHLLALRSIRSVQGGDLLDLLAVGCCLT